MKNRLVFSTLVAITGLILIMGCAKTKPFDYHPDTEIPQGPGVFSKEKGEFTVYDSNKKQQPPAQQEQTVSATPGTAKTPEDNDSFLQFQEWKKDQAEFEAFQEWKRSQQGSHEYQEFQEWKRWREYKRWNDEQKKSNKIDY
jgi:hypothetical protein